MSEPPTNPYLEASLGLIYAKTALPIIFIMGVNGLLAVVDALFLGHYVGPEALAAVTLISSIYVLIAAPAAELCLRALTLVVLQRTARKGSVRWGLFETSRGMTS